MRRFVRSAFLPLALASLALAACSTSSAVVTSSSANELDTAAERGRQIAARDCAGCHAIDQSTVSPRTSAPPFSDIRRRYNRASLAREFIAIGMGGHFQMPPTQISLIDGGDLISFIESLGP